MYVYEIQTGLQEHVAKSRRMNKREREGERFPKNEMQESVILFYADGEFHFVALKHSKNIIYFFLLKIIFLLFNSTNFFK